MKSATEFEFVEEHMPYGDICVAWVVVGAIGAIDAVGMAVCAVYGRVFDGRTHGWN